MKKLSNILIGTLLLLFAVACSDPYAEERFSNMEDLPAASYMNAPENAETFSLWVELLNHTGLFNTLNLSADYTCFVPVNKAMQNFLNSKGLSSVSELDNEEAVRLVKYHTILKKKYQTSDFSDGMFPDSTATGDYLSIEFRDGGLSSTYVNGESLILELNISVTNAVIHTLDKVLTPVTGSIYSKLDDSYSIMRDALDLVGFDFLNQLGGFYRYTLFAVPDAVYKAHNPSITSAQELAQYLGADTDYQVDNTINMDNKLVQYLSYHTMLSATSFSSLISGVERGVAKNVGVLANSQLINVSLLEETNSFYLNYDKETGTGAQITIKNINCKNGVMHVIDDIMVVKTPPATKVQWDVADDPLLAAICANYQKENLSVTSTTHFTELDVLPYLSLRGPSSFYYYVANKNNAEYYKAKNKDFLVLSMGAYGWIQMESPTIIAGKYKVYIEHLNVSGSALAGKISLIVDGEYVGKQISTRGANKTTDKFTKAEIGEIEFTESKTHTVRLLSGDQYISYIDCITFEPIK